MRESKNEGAWCAGRLSASLAAFLLLTALGCSGESQDPASTGPSFPSNSTTGVPQRDLVHPVVRIETNLGAITIELDAEHAPGTVHNFINYVTAGYYNDTIFHYVDPGNMILGGGYTVDGRPKSADAAIRNEAHNGLKNLRGTIAMARDRAAIDSATSQFFINLTDAPQRDFRGESPDEYGYCVFGKVTEGLDIAEQISQSTTRNLGGDLAQAPEPPVVIQSIRVVR